MLRISAAQMAVINKAAQSAFLLRVVYFLAVHFADASEGSAGALLEEVRKQVGDAFDLGLTTEQEVICYIIATKYLGEGFARRGTVRDYFASERGPEEKLAFLEALVLVACDRADRRQRLVA